MANPFGSADETLSKNGGHVNQANLIFALIPRAANKMVEVINAATVTPSASGSYDVDGYWRSANTALSTADYTIASARSAGQDQTLIALVRYNSGGGGSTPSAQVLGMFNDATGGGGGPSRYFCRQDVYSRSLEPFIRDGSSNAAGLTATDPGADTSGIGIKGGDSVPAYSALIRHSGTTTVAAGSSTNANVSASDATLNRLVIRTTNKWACQAVFVYDAILSDAHIEAIIDDPGAVISYAAAGGVPKTTRLTMLGIG
jgi:hypothetical protein